MTDRSGSPADTAALQALFDRTSRSAYGLALRICGSSARASAACERAYLEAAEGAAQGAGEMELWLLGRVRHHALAILGEQAVIEPRSGSAGTTYTGTTVVRDGLQRVDSVARRAIELAYFGGLGVGEIASLLGERPEGVRAAMRGALLELGALTRDGQETTA